MQSTKSAPEKAMVKKKQLKKNYGSNKIVMVWSKVLAEEAMRSMTYRTIQSFQKVIYK